jgi:hypothetical protein
MESTPDSSVNKNHATTDDIKLLSSTKKKLAVKGRNSRQTSLFNRSLKKRIPKGSKIINKSIK